MGDRFVARVTNVFDPEFSGRVQIRIHGLHDDVSRVPDDKLPWARCIFPVTNSIFDGVASATTGLMPGTTVVGHFADDAKQIPLVDGTVGGTTARLSDFPKANIGEDFNSVLGMSLPSIALPELKFVANKTIGSIDFVGQSISSMMKMIESGNIVGAIEAVVDAVDQFDEVLNNVKNSTIEQVNGIIQAFASDALAAVERTTDVVTVPTGHVIQYIKEVQDAQERIGRLTLSRNSTTANTEIESERMRLLEQNRAERIARTYQTLSQESPVNEPVVNPELTDTINHVAGSIATRTSKTPIVSIEQVISRMNGHRFVMGHVMPYLEAMLNTIEEKHERLKK